MTHRALFGMILVSACATACVGPPDGPPVCVARTRSARSAVRDLGASSQPGVAALAIDAQVEADEWLMVAVAGTVDPMAGDVPEASVSGLGAAWEPVAVSLRPSMPGSTTAPRKLWVFAAVAPRAATGSLTVSFDGVVNLAQATAVAVAGVEEPVDVVTAHAQGFETTASIPMDEVDPDALVVAAIFAGENNPLGPGHTFGVEPVDMETASSTYGLEQGKERVTTTAWAIGRSTLEAQFVDHNAGAHWLGVGIELRLGDAPVSGMDTGAGGDDGSMPGDSGDASDDGDGDDDGAGDHDGESDSGDTPEDEPLEDEPAIEDATAGTDCTLG